MKFCKDCANFSPMKYTDSDGICSAPEYGVNLVTGKPNTRTCEAQRTSFNPCGTEAVFFRAKVDIL